MLKKALQYLEGDRAIWILSILMLAFSLVTVYSFVPVLVKTEGGTPFKYLFKHFIYVLIGLVLMYWVHRTNPVNLSRLARFLYFLSIALLIFTFFFGVSINNASRWIRIPVISLTFQTSDFAKLALVIFMARTMVKKRELLDDWKKGFWPVLWPVLLTCGLIAKDNFSTAMIIFAIAITLMFVGQVRIKMIAATILAGVVGFGMIILLHKALPDLNLLPRLETWENRIFNRVAEEKSILDNIQSINAELAIHNGGIIGEGVGKGKLKLYTAEAYADFFYASFVEEFGLIGGAALVFIYLILLFRVIRIGLKSERLFETYVAVGIGLLLITQASVNMLVCTGIFPVTGQNMPFLAMGGSALVMVCLSLGIILSISREQVKPAEKNNELV
jgi:cell division protein FtsW